MRFPSRSVSPLLPLLLLLAVTPADGYEHWNDIRHSALLPDDTLVVRMENPNGGGAENYVLYDNSGIIEGLMSHSVDGPSTLQAIVPGPMTHPMYYGFRFVSGDGLDLMPVPIADGVAPGPDDLTRVATDITGDELFGYTNLDLVDCHVSFSSTELFATLTNAGGGFPVSGGLGFFGYLLGVANPAQADPDTVFALMYTYEQAGIISPGLYKVMGTGLGDLEKLGDVEVQEYPESNTLMLSCQLSDLLADPDFQAWYEPADPIVGVAGFTQRITLFGGPQEADRSPGGTCSLREFAVAPGPNTLPVLADHLLEGSGPTATARIDYADSDGHCPVLAEIVFDGTDAYPLYPQTLDYTGAVTYVTDAGIAPLANESWSTAVFRFSDDLSNVVEYEVPGSSVDETTLVRLALQVSPNPFNPSTTITLSLPSSGRARVAVYDTRGALVRTLVDAPVGSGDLVVTWNGRSNSGRRVGTGVYLLRAEALGETVLGKLVLLK